MLSGSAIRIAPPSKWRDWVRMGVVLVLGMMVAAHPARAWFLILDEPERPVQQHEQQRETHENSASGAAGKVRKSREGAVSSGRTAGARAQSQGTKRPAAPGACTVAHCVRTMGTGAPLSFFFETVLPEGWKVVSSDPEFLKREVSWKYLTPTPWREIVHDMGERLQRLACIRVRVLDHWREVRVARGIHCPADWVLRKGGLHDNLTRWAREADLQLRWFLEDNAGHAVDYPVLDGYVFYRASLVKEVLPSIVSELRAQGGLLDIHIIEGEGYRNQGVLIVRRIHSVRMCPPAKSEVGRRILFGEQHQHKNKGNEGGKQ